MRLRIVNAKDAGAGIFFSVLGLLTLYIAHDYVIGTATNMGPGYFPILIGLGMVILGGFNCIRAISVSAPGQIGSLPVRPLVLTPLGVVIFALLIDSHGLIAAVLALVIVCRFAVTPYRVGEVILVCLILSAISAVLFVYGLGLPASLLISR